MEVSVIVPVHNEEAMLRYTLLSILMLDADEWIFILDRCTDKSKELIEKYAKKLNRNIKLLIVKSKSDWARHVNFLFDIGIRNASGEKVFRTDADIIQDYKRVNRYLRTKIDMVSFAVYPAPKNFFSFWNLFVKWIIHHILRKGFTGTFVISREKYFKCPLRKDDELLFDTLLLKKFKENKFTYRFTRVFNLNLRPYVKEKRYSIGVAYAKLKKSLIKVLLLSIVRLMPEMFVGYWHTKFKQNK